MSEYFPNALYLLQTEVVVNTVGNDLILDSGAVSTALLNAAGPELQELINQHATAGKVGEVIITKGCNLKSKLVFHTIAPRWSNGQGATQKVECCLTLSTFTETFTGKPCVVPQLRTKMNICISHTMPIQCKHTILYKHAQ